MPDEKGYVSYDRFKNLLWWFLPIQPVKPFLITVTKLAIMPWFLVGETDREGAKKLNAKQGNYLLSCSSDLSNLTLLVMHRAGLKRYRIYRHDSIHKFSVTGTSCNPTSTISDLMHWARRGIGCDRPMELNRFTDLIADSDPFAQVHGKYF